MTLPGCYKATVNEPETINQAQAYCWVRNRGATGAPRAFGIGLALTPPIERS